MQPTLEKYQKVRIASRRDHAPDLWSMRVQPEERLAFQPGQYATLGVEGARPSGDGSHVLERPYSIVSSPLEDEIEFFFELVPEGGLTPVLYQFQAGASLLMRRQAKGLFGLDTKSGHKCHYLVATVTGVAPYVSMARTLAREAEAGHAIDQQLVILQGASRSWEFAYREELDGLAKKFDWLRYIPTISRPWEDPAWKGEVGRVEDVLRKYLDALGLEPVSTTAYLCGHPEMISNAKQILRRRGFPKESLREELYWVPKK
ncbi:MAG TPA: ferredoxin--NADP reductase [Terriglobia bacterium]|nr:ferredoxin--NADP reductase [Terriglobia bacterium]